MQSQFSWFVLLMIHESELRLKLQVGLKRRLSVVHPWPLSDRSPLVLTGPVLVLHQVLEGIGGVLLALRKDLPVLGLQQLLD